MMGFIDLGDEVEMHEVPTTTTATSKKKDSSSSSTRNAFQTMMAASASSGSSTSTSSYARMEVDNDDDDELGEKDNDSFKHLTRSDISKGKAPVRPTSVLLPTKNGTASEDNLPWVEKYRPSQLDELVSHQDIISTISKFIDENKLPHLLFYGPPGTGKTSTILACARKLYGPTYKTMIMELNASDDRGIDVVREQIKNFASTKKIFSSGFKLIILDEADAMTQVAQNALRRIVEKYTKNVRFCIICNYVSKIIPALQSRCTRFRFAPLKEDQIRSRLDHVAELERVNIDEGGRKALLRLSSGDMRRMLNIMQSVHAAYDIVTEVNVFSCVGAPLPRDMVRIAEWLFNENFEVALSNIQKLKTDKGLALNDIISELHNLLSSMELPPKVRVFLLKHLADIEYNLSVGCTERIQLCSLVGAFRVSVEMATKG